MVRDFHNVIGQEARRQLRRRIGRAEPDVAVACVGGGSNSIGLFHAFLDSAKVRLIGVEAGGTSMNLGEHAARFSGGRLGVLHGTKTLVLQDDDGQVAPTHSVSAGLDYPAVGPEHVHLQERGRIEYTSADDREAIDAFHLLSHTEGILPALESAHALAEVVKLAPTMSKEQVILVNLSGRGDKDVESVIAFEQQRAARDRRQRHRSSICGSSGGRGGIVSRQIAQVFERCRKERRAAFIPYITAGDPDLRRTEELVEALVRGGADIIELGAPFSDPIADGPVNQRSSFRALSAGTTLAGGDRSGRSQARRARHTDRSLLLLQPDPRPRPGLVYRAGERGWPRRPALSRSAAGGERGTTSTAGCASTESIRSSLLAPTSSQTRIKKAAAAASGFVYYVSRAGVTGERKAMRAELAKEVKLVRRRVKIQIAVGFGISSPEQVQEVARYADGVVVGSALVRLVEEHGSEPNVADLLEHKVAELTEPLRRPRRRLLRRR